MHKVHLGYQGKYSARFPEILGCSDERNLLCSSLLLKRAAASLHHRPRLVLIRSGISALRHTSVTSSILAHPVSYTHITWPEHDVHYQRPLSLMVVVVGRYYYYTSSIQTYYHHLQRMIRVKKFPGAVTRDTR